MKVWEAMHCPCVYESAYATLSLHRTKEGAEKVVQASKDAVKKRFDEFYKKREPITTHKWDDFDGWSITETKVLE